MDMAVEIDRKFLATLQRTYLNFLKALKAASAIPLFVLVKIFPRFVRFWKAFQKSSMQIWAKVWPVRRKGLKF
jgi:hypothetical protein